MWAKRYGNQIIVYNKDAMGRTCTVAVLDAQPSYGTIGIQKVVEALNVANKQ